MCNLYDGTLHRSYCAFEPSQLPTYYLYIYIVIYIVLLSMIYYSTITINQLNPVGSNGTVASISVEDVVMIVDK